MKTVNQDQNISTVQRIRQLGLPAREQRKALAALALVVALISLFFTKSEIKTGVKKAPEINKVLKAQ
jgi:hypothetical protein